MKLDELGTLIWIAGLVVLAVSVAGLVGVTGWHLVATGAASTVGAGVWLDLKGGG